MVIFFNYDYIDEDSETSPGAGPYGDMSKYDSMEEFFEEKRKRRKRKEALLDMLGEP